MHYKPVLKFNLDSTGHLVGNKIPCIVSTSRRHYLKPRQYYASTIDTVIFPNEGHDLFDIIMLLDKLSTCILSLNKENITHIEIREQNYWSSDKEDRDMEIQEIVKFLTEFPNLQSVKLRMARKYWFPLDVFDRALPDVVRHDLAVGEILDACSMSYKEFVEEGLLKMEDVPVVNVELHPNVMKEHRKNHHHTLYESMYEKHQARNRNSAEEVESESDSEP
jgi:hypothetical protein